ncbi:hypothetical protein [Vibrio hyugaensis]|uniref:hypothetical protein n=1 Tax=Vibrio hyugaensis TaxID=1534743 RepID=UPI0012E05F31|nr:hypothetical protein [Vibrio hyugaensis]
MMLTANNHLTYTINTAVNAAPSSLTANPISRSPIKACSVSPQKHFSHKKYDNDVYDGN